MTAARRSHAASQAPVLLVEDDEDYAAQVTRILEADGHAVVTVEDGAAALAWLAEHPAPSLVLVDLVMPGVDGWTLLTRLRADPERAGIPVVVSTVLESRDPRLERLGAIPMLCKPADAATIRALARLHCRTACG